MQETIPQQAYTEAAQQITNVLDPRERKFKVSVGAGSEDMAVLCDNGAKTSSVDWAGVYVFAQTGPSLRRPRRPKAPQFLHPYYTGGSINLAFRVPASCGERTEGNEFVDPQWLVYIVFQISDLLSATRKIPFTMELLEFVVHYAETIQIIFWWLRNMLNNSQTGFTSGKSLKSLSDSLFWCGWDLTNFTDSVAKIHKMTDLTTSGRQDLLESLCSQAACSFDSKQHGLVLAQIELLTCPQPRKQEIRGKLGLNAQKAAAMQGLFSNDTLVRNTLRINALPIQEKEKQELRAKATRVRKIATASHLSVAQFASTATSATDQKLFTSIKAKVHASVKPLLTAVNEAWTAVVTLDRVIAVVRDGDGEDWHELTHEAAMRENYSRCVSLWITAVGSREKAFGRIDYYIRHHQDTQMKEKAELLKEQLRLFLKQDDTKTRKRPPGYDSNAARNARRKHEQDQRKIVPPTQPSVCGWACGNEDASTQAKENSQTACSSKPACGEDTATHSRAATTKRAQPHPAATRTMGMFTSDIQTPKVVVSSKRPADVAWAAPPAIDVAPQEDAAGPSKRPRRTAAANPGKYTETFSSDEEPTNVHSD